MGYTVQLRLKDGTYQDVALPESDAGTLVQQFEDDERQAAFDDLELTLDNTDGAWTTLFSASNLVVTDRYPACYGFRVLLDGTPFWEGDLDYTSVQHDEESSTTQVRVLDGLRRLAHHNAAGLKRDYSGIAIVSGARHSRQLQVNSVLDASGEPLCEDDEIEFGHVKPNGKIDTYTLKVRSVDVPSNTITFKRRLKTNLVPGDAIVVKSPWYRNKSAQWVLEALADLVPGFDAPGARVIDYDATTWSDVLDVCDFSGKSVGEAIQLVADWVNAQVFCKLNVLYIVGRERQADPAPAKDLDALVGEGSPQPVGAQRYDLIEVKGRDGRQVRKGILPFGGNSLALEFPFSRDRARLQAVADRYWDYWGRVKGQIQDLPVAADGTAYTLGKRVTLGGVNYMVVRVSQDLEDNGELSLDLLTESGILPDPGAYDQDDLQDDDEDPPEPASFVFTKDYSPTFNDLFPASKYPRLTTTQEQVGEVNGKPVFEDKQYRLYELRWAYPYDLYRTLLWRFEVTVWPDGKDREKPHTHVAVKPDQQPDGLYYAKVRLPAGKLWWADVTAVLTDLRESGPSDPNSSSIEDDVVPTYHYYSADVTATLVLFADAQPLDGGGAGPTAHKYSADVQASTWLDARPDGTRVLQRYSADVQAMLWLDAEARPLASDKTHRYSALVDASTWLDARPDGTRVLQRYSAEMVASLWLTSTTDVGDPGGTGLSVALTSYVDDAPGTAAKEVNLVATLSGTVITADRVIFHATRNGNPLKPFRADLDAGATSVVARWERCAKAGDALSVTKIILRMHHKRTKLTGVSGGPPWNIVGGASETGHNPVTGKPPALPAPTVTAVAGTGGPHSFEVDISWAALTSAEKDRLYKVFVWVYHNGWVQKDPVDVRQLVLAGATSYRQKIHVQKKLTSGAGNYPNVKAALRDYYKQTGAAGYLYGSGDGTTVSNQPQVPPLEFFSTDNGYLRGLQLELGNDPGSPTITEVLNNLLVASSSKIYVDGASVAPRRVVVRDGANFKLPAGMELFNGLAIPVWNASGTAPGYFNWLVYFPRFMGLPAWSSTIIFMAGDYCYSGTTVYRSKLDNNVGNAVSNSTWWANVGTVPAANKWARFSAAGTLSDDGASDPVDPVTVTEPPPGASGCFGKDVYVLCADWTGVPFGEIWEQRKLFDPEYGLPIIGFDVRARHWAVTGAVEVLRHSGLFSLVDVLGVKVTPDHLYGVADRCLEGMTHLRWNAAGILGGQLLVSLQGKEATLVPAPKTDLANISMANEVFNLRTGTGNYFVSAGPVGPWQLVHNLKTGL